MHPRTDSPHPLLGRAGRAALPVVVAGLLFSGTADAAAQQSPARPRDEILTELFAALSPSTGIRLVTIGGVAEEGRLQSVGPESIDVARNGETFPIGYDFVRSVSVEGGHGLQGAVWGAAGGAVVGVFFGAMYASFDCRTASDCNYTEREGAWRWGTFIGGVGGGIGFYFGRRQVHWHPIFP